MKNRWLSLLLVLAVLISPILVTAQAAEGDCAVVALFNGWARASSEAMPNSAVYGLLINLSDAEDTLVSASTDAAEAVELHEVVMGEGDVMQMRPVEGGFVVPSGGFTQLQPGGLHIMLINLTQPLAAGSTLHLTLTFETAGEIELAVPVRDAAAMAGMDEDMSEGMAMPAMEATDEPMMAVDAPQWGEACDGVFVLDPWVRPAAAGMPNSAAYGLLLNLTGSDDILISASSAAAEAVELHEVVMGEGDVMRMQPIEGGIEVPAGEAALLQPGGLHIMLINLTGELADGDTVDLLLTFAEAGDMSLTVPVRAPEETGMGAGGM